MGSFSFRMTFTYIRFALGKTKMVLKASLSSHIVSRELSELHKVTAVSKSAAHEAVLSAEQMARQELTEALERQRVEHHREKEKLLLEV